MTDQTNGGTLRIGFVGAGGNTRLRHIPGFRAVDGVEFAGVANSTLESSQKAAAEHDLGTAYADWRQLVRDDSIDAVCIGTYPDLHADVTCAALEAGKHVLCEARMARNVAEARRMLEASKARKDLVAHLVPSPFGLEVGPTVDYLMKGNFVGDLREVIITGAEDMFWDYSKPLHWRQNREISGVNTLTLGILHETAMRWLPEPESVFAMSQTFEPKRPDLDAGEYREVTVPDVVHAVAALKGGARALYHFNGLALFGPGKSVLVHGSRGTLRVEFEPEERVFAGRAGDTALKEVKNEDAEPGTWTVEEDFVRAIRGEKVSPVASFKDGVAYMEFTEAVIRSAESNELVDVG